MQGILIADDSATVRQVIRNHLTRESLSVCGEANDGEETIEKAWELKPELIVLDLAMPKTNGYVAASVLKEMMPDVRIILFTMYRDAVARTFGNKGLSVDAVVAKSEGIIKLTDCIQTLLGRGPDGAQECHP